MLYLIVSLILIHGSFSQTGFPITGTSLECVIKTHHKLIQSLVDNIQNLTNKNEILSKVVQTLQDELSVLKGNITSEQKRYSGINYFRWGRTSCPNDTSRIYTGYVGMSAYNQEGGGSSYVCLAGDPEWPEHTHPGLNTGSYIYGTHYWAIEMEDILPHDQSFNDVPCAACEDKAHGQQIMIPGKRTCPRGWSHQYDGYLMSERTADHHVSHADYICVDKDYEFLPGTGEVKLGAHIIPVESVCGTLACPPYEEGRELACVVCTK